MSAQRDADAGLVNAAARKILAAQARGTLSQGLRLDIDSYSVDLANVTTSDLAWFRKQFPGDPEPWGAVYASPRRSQRGLNVLQPMRIKHLLRPRTDKDGNGWFVPSVVYTLSEPHVCRHWIGYADENGAAWKCADRACGKRLTKTKAREIGLLPRLQRKGSAA